MAVEISFLTMGVDAARMEGYSLREVYEMIGMEEWACTLVEWIMRNTQRWYGNKWVMNEGNLLKELLRS